MTGFHLFPIITERIVPVVRIIRHQGLADGPYVQYCCMATVMGCLPLNMSHYVPMFNREVK